MYQVVIVGAGNISVRFDTPYSKDILTYSHAFSINESFCLKGFYDVDYERALEAAKIWGGQAYIELEEALVQADVVCCCVPDRYHGIMLEKIAEYKPRLVITEKPLTTSLIEARRIRKLFDKKIPLIVNYSRRFLKEFQTLKDEISSYGKYLRGVGYYGKGILHNGSHMIDILRFLLGEIDDVKSLLTGIVDFEGDISKNAILSVRGGKFFMVAIDSRIVTIFEIELFFEKARIRILDGGTKIEIYYVRESNSYSGYNNYVLQQERDVDYSNALVGLVNNVQGYLEQKEYLRCTLEDGIRALDICLRIRGE